jgi:hypothetical protein
LKVALGFFTYLIRHEEGKHAVCEECKGEASSQGDHLAASAGGKFSAGFLLLLGFLWLGKNYYHTARSVILLIPCYFE